MTISFFGELTFETAVKQTQNF